jgi:Zn-dependent protease/CBS domain-containing protein
METGLKLGYIWGIPISLHLSWFLIFALLTWSLSTGYFPTEYPQLAGITHVVLGVVTSILFFASVLAHELGHAYLALRNKIPVKSITLFIFGGVAQIGQEPQSPGVEFRIAIAGPLVSLGLAVLFGATFLLDQAIPYLAAPSLYLMRINLILALFNMIPGFPLDGGRVLRAIVWRFTNSFQRATQIASLSGQAVAFGFIGLGIFTIFSGQFFNGVWLIFIGWFLQNAAASTHAQANIQQHLRGIKVGQVMSRNCARVGSLIPISTLVEERVLTGGERCFFVADNGKLEGMLTLKDISKVPQPSWRFTTTRQAMVPANRLVSVTPDTELMTALQTMDNADVAQIPVIVEGELVGVLSREQIVRYLRSRAELGI